MSLKKRIQEIRKSTASAFATWDVIDAIVEEIEQLKGKAEEKKPKKPEKGKTP